jgi:YVTN family beta-propeller protein
VSPTEKEDGNEMWKEGKPNRKRGWALGAAFAVAIAIGMVLSPAVLSAVSAQTTGAVNTPVKDAKCKVGIGPQDPAYDPVNHEIYVPNAGSANISVVKAPCTKAGTIKLPESPEGTYPVAAAFDPQNNYVYVTDVDANAVYVISGTKLVATLHGFDRPEAIVYDPSRADMIVTNFDGDNLTQVYATSAIGSIPVGMAPDGIDYDPTDGVLNVANYYSGNVTVLDAVTLTTEFSVGVGSNPEGVAYDPSDYFDYVTNFGSGTVSWLDGDVFPGGSISGFDEPSSATWSQAKLAVYVTNYGSGVLSAIGGASGTSIVQNITVAKGIDGSAYDDANDTIYVTDSTTGFLYVYST